MVHFAEYREPAPAQTFDDVEGPQRMGLIQRGAVQLGDQHREFALAAGAQGYLEELGSTAR